MNLLKWFPANAEKGIQKKKMHNGFGENNLRLESLEGNQLKIWDDFVDRSPQGSIYHKAFWLNCVADLIGGGIRILGVFEGNNLVGGLGLCYKESLFGKVCMPYYARYNGILLSAPESQQPYLVISNQLLICQLLVEGLQKLRFRRITLYNSPQLKDVRANQWANWRIDAAYTIEIPISDLPKLRASIGKSVFKQARRSEEMGIQVSIGDDFDAYYKLLIMTFQRRNRPLPKARHQMRTLYEMARELGHAKMYFAKLPNGQPISARIVLFSNHMTAHGWESASNPSFHHTGVAYFLMWETIKDLSNDGFQFLDLNGANIPGIANFKSKFGGSLEHYFVTVYNKYFLQGLYDLGKNQLRWWIKKRIFHEI